MLPHFHPPAFDAHGLLIDGPPFPAIRLSDNFMFHAHECGDYIRLRDGDNHDAGAFPRHEFFRLFLAGVPDDAHAFPPDRVADPDHHPELLDIDFSKFEIITPK